MPLEGATEKHPEQRDGEQLLGLLMGSVYKLMQFKTKRRGEIAYYPDSREVAPPPKDEGEENELLFAVFISVEEAERCRIKNL